MTNRTCVKLIAPSLAALLLAACGGGGSATGGGGGLGLPPSPPASPPASPPPPPPPPPLNVAPFRTSEFSGNSGGNSRGAPPRIKAEYAYASGGTGAGITVAVIDTGIDVDHPEFAGAIHPASRDMDDGLLGVLPRNTLDTDAADPDFQGHGTWVAGVLAARKNNVRFHGVAYEAQIMALRADRPGTCDSGGCTFPTDTIARAIDYAVANGADVINLSLGGGSTLGATLRTSIVDAVNAGVIVVAAAGNADSGDPADANPEAPGIFASDAQARGLMVVAGALDLNDQIADISHRAGTVRNFYITAPGELVLTTGVDDPATPSSPDYVLASGTSIATPAVAGALALVLDAWPTLTPTQAVNLILTSARDLGDPGVDAIYGRGALDLQRVFEPVGTASVDFAPAGGAAAAGDSVLLDTALAPASGAFGDWAARAALFDGMMFRDSYDRPFILGDTSGLKPRSGAADRFASLADSGRRQGGVVETETGSTYMNWRDDRPARANFGMGDSERDYRYGATFRFDGGAGAFGFASDSSAPGGAVAQIGLLSFQDQAGAAGSLAHAERWAHGAYRFGAWRVGARASLDSGAFSAVSVGRFVGEHFVSFEAGAVRETGAAMGGLLGVRFGDAEEARSTFGAVEWTGPVGLGWRGVARGELLKANIAESHGVAVLDQPWASAWSLGVERRLTPDLSLGFALSQSLRAESGRIGVNVPVRATLDGGTIYEARTAALTPSGREIGLESVAQWRAADRIFLRGAVRYANEPGHVAGAAGELMGWADVAVKF